MSARIAMSRTRRDADMTTFLCAIAIVGALAACLPARAAAPAVPLYEYRRSKSDTTSVEIGARRAGAPAISPRIFSNFLEHLGGAVYEALWANVVQNPQFEADKAGRLARWGLRDEAVWAEDGLVGRCVRLPEDASAYQPVALPAGRGGPYAGSLWARAVGAAPAVVEVSLRRPEKPAVLARKLVEVRGDAWRPAAFSLTLPDDGLRRGEAAEVQLSCVRGAACVDMVELFPPDTRDGCDPDVVRMARDLRIELLRWPGGNFASGYHWRDGVGPRERRRTVPNPAWSGLETHHFGTDEFMRFCKRIGAKPQVCVNAGDGTAEEAAAWVEYCNGGPETPMGRLRVENGHPEPYRVRVWEIGNELYGAWQIGHTDAAGNAARFVRFRDAMLAADPSIEVIATGKADSYVGRGLEFDRAWNTAVLNAAQSHGGLPPYLSLHPLVSLPGGLPARFTYQQVYESAMAHPVWWAETYLPALRRLAAERYGAGAGVRAAPTEWGIIIGGPNWPRYPNHDAQSGAVYAALFFQAMLRTADFVGLSNVTALLHGGGIKRWGGVAYGDPMYYVERMYGATRPTRLLPTTVSGPGYDVPERDFLPAVHNVPYLDVQAAEASGVRCIFIVNRDPRATRRARFSLAAAPREATIETLSADPQQGNGPDHPTSVAPGTSALHVEGKAFEHDFPPCSVSLIRLR